ncbi:MAG: helix-turn-helix domain-containing protein [Anaerolineaceae bacterium]|nr:helix-turn-helix domain-containing protein [Anaerolineaceae bacterium]
MDQLLTLITREINRFEIMPRLQAKLMSQKEAAAQSGIRALQVKRLWKAYQTNGAAGLVSQRRGRYGKMPPAIN